MLERTHLPKNIRQIGQAENEKKVYIEDYVMTYMKQLAERNSGRYRGAVLLGGVGSREIQQECSIFVKGAVEIPNLRIEGGIGFSNETWSRIYELVKGYFPEEEIVGWYLTASGLLPEQYAKIKAAHEINFGQANKILFTYDSLEQEEQLYYYQKKEFGRLRGYYVFYERNEEMQNYMVDTKSTMQTETQSTDRAVAEVRRTLEKKERPRNVSNKKQGHGLYTLSTCMMVAVLFATVAITRKYDQLDSMETALIELSETLQDNLSDLPKAVEKEFVEETGGEAEKKEKEGEVTIVEVISGNVEPLEEEQTEKVKEEEEKEIQEEQEQKNTEQTDEKETEVVEETVNRPMQYYTVQEGDTLVGISLKHYQTAKRVKDILKANELTNENLILAGQVLIMPE